MILETIFPGGYVVTHGNRLRAIRAAFTEANPRLAGRLEALDDVRATATSASGWNPPAGLSRIGDHA